MALPVGLRAFHHADFRRFFWALNDESGAVPYGVPEAVGEILAVRPEMQPTFLSILCAHLTEEDMDRVLDTNVKGTLLAVHAKGKAAADVIGKYWPQIVLGLAFSWGALMGWPAAFGRLDWPALVLYAGSISWVIAPTSLNLEGKAKIRFTKPASTDMA